MNNAEATIQIEADPTNPGQFFACCGVLELAERLWNYAEGCFIDHQFHLWGRGKLQDLLAALVEEIPSEVAQLEGGLPIKKLIAPLRLKLGAGSEITIDAWMAVRRDKEVVATGNPPWNFWSGQQTSFRIWRALREALADQLRKLAPKQFKAVFNQRVLLPGRFGFDPGAAWNALDVGFSPNEQGIEVASSPATELLAAIGIQRFRPILSSDRQTFTYATWGQRLGPAVASAAAAGVLVVPPCTRFRGRVVSRGPYAGLGYSTPLRGDDHE